MEPKDLIGFLDTGIVMAIIITFGMIINKIISGDTDPDSTDPYKILYHIYKERCHDLLIMIGFSAMLLFAWIKEMISS
jgi:hypothetical protein